ncbi:MAG: glycosyltransferase, partial [Pseudomonadota bacterium]
MVARNLARPYRFLCLTEDPAGVRSEVECRPLPGFDVGDLPAKSNWRKLSCHGPDLDDLRGPVLFLDLDLVIVAGIDCFFDYPASFCIIENYTQPANRSTARSPSGASRSCAM